MLIIVCFTQVWILYLPNKMANDIQIIVSKLGWAV